MPYKDRERAKVAWKLNSRDRRKANPKEHRAQQRRNYAKHRNRKANKIFQKRYGISLEDKQTMFDAQEGRCANEGCRKLFKSLTDANTDHNHETGKVRALLCTACNGSLGFLKESPVAIRGLAEYIERF